LTLYDVAVIGCGAVGRLTAAAAAAAGLRVASLCMGWSKISDGLIRLFHRGGIIHAKVLPIRSFEEARRAELVVAAVRAPEAHSVAEKLHGKSVLYTQPTPALEEVFEKDGSAGLLAFYGCAWLSEESSAVEYEASAARIVGSGGQTAGIVNMLAEGFTRLGVKAELGHREHLQSLLWDYVAAHASVQPVAAVLGATYGGLRRTKYALGLVESLARETMLIMDSKGLRKLRSPVDAAHELLKVGGCRAKIEKDVEKGIGSEIDYMNGLIVREAIRLGLYAPYNDSLYLQVKALEELVRGT